MRHSSHRRLRIASTNQSAGCDFVDSFERVEKATAKGPVERNGEPSNRENRIRRVSKGMERITKM